MSITQFAFHDAVKNTPPECRIKELYDKVNNLTTAEKQEVFDKCRDYNGIYRLAGWQFNFRPYMKRYIVKTYDSWHEQYAFSKENIRKNIYTNDGVKEIHEIFNLEAHRSK
jgi:hypothetical protein